MAKSMYTGTVTLTGTLTSLAGLLGETETDLIKDVGLNRAVIYLNATAEYELKANGSNNSATQPAGEKPFLDPSALLLAEFSGSGVTLDITVVTYNDR